MEREKTVTKGLVLRVTDTKEADQILTVLTQDLGRISVIAKGARSRRSRVSAACQLFCYSEMALTQRGEWYYLNEAATLELFDGVRQDIVLLSLGTFFAEMAEFVVAEESEQELRLLLNALYALGTLRREPTQVETAYIFRLLALAGFAPMADGCAVCGAEPEKPLLDTVQGIVHCTGCSKTGGLSLPLTGAALQALRYILACDDKKLYSFSLPEADMKLLCHAAEAYAAAQLERSFHTLDYYKSICGI